MALTTKFNDGTRGRTNTPKTASDHQAEVDAAAQERRERDVADLAAESAGMENGRIKRFRPGTEAALRAEQARQGTDGRMTAAATAILTAEAWDRQLVTVGGVTMTNAERQSARKRILDNPDQSLQWLRERNLLKTGEEQDFLHALRRMTEIDDMRRNNGGRVSPELDDEYRRHQQRFGRAADAATAQMHKDNGFSAEQVQDKAVSTTTRSADSAQLEGLRDAILDQPNDGLQQPPAAQGSTGQVGTMEQRTASTHSREDAYALYPSAPLLADAFVMAKAATVPLDRPPEQMPAPADPTMTGTGLNF